MRLKSEVICTDWVTDFVSTHQSVSGLDGFDPTLRSRSGGSSFSSTGAFGMAVRFIAVVQRAMYRTGTKDWTRTPAKTRKSMNYFKATDGPWFEFGSTCQQPRQHST